MNADERAALARSWAHASADVRMAAEYFLWLALTAVPWVPGDTRFVRMAWHCEAAGVHGPGAFL